MGNKVGSLEVDIALESANFIAGLKRAAAETEKTGKAINSAMNFAKGAAIGFVGALSIDAISNAAQAAFDYADAIVDLSDRTGASTTTLQQFRYAAQLSGSSVESADAAVGKFAKSLGSALNGNDAMAKGLRNLGVTSGDVDTALRQFMDGVAKLPTAAQRNATAMQYMGKTAGDLTMLLGQGSDGFANLAREAQSLGIVLEESVLRNAGQVNDKMDTMKMIVDAQMASAFINNADAIGQMADSLIKLGAAAASAFGALSNMGNLDILRSPGLTRSMSGLMGNSGNATLKAAAGGLLSNDAGRRDLYALASEQRRNLASKYGVRNATGQMDAAAWSRMSQEDKNDYNRLTGNRNNAYQAAQNANRPAVVRPPRGNNLTIPTGGGGKAASKPSGPSAAEIAEREANRLRDYNRDAASAQREIWSAMGSLSVNPREQYGWDRLALEQERTNRVGEIDAGTVAGKDGKARYTKAEADNLRALEEQIYVRKGELITQREVEDIAREETQLKVSGLTIQQDLASSELDLARSSKERRDISIRLIDLQTEQERIQLQAIINSQTASDAEKKIAEARLAILGKLRDASVAEAERDNAGPMAQYLDAIPRTANEINDDLEKIQVEGVEKLSDGLLDAVMGVGSLKDAFKDMASSVVRDLIQIGIQQSITKPLGQFLFGGGDGGGGGLFGSIVKSIVPSLAGARANGGLTRKGDYLMGERGPEIVSIGNTANVTSTAALRGLQGGGNSGPNIRIDSIVSNDPEAIRRAVMEGVVQAIPVISQQASDKALKTLRRPRM